MVDTRLEEGEATLPEAPTLRPTTEQLRFGLLRYLNEHQQEARRTNLGWRRKGRSCPRRAGAPRSSDSLIVPWLARLQVAHAGLCKIELPEGAAVVCAHAPDACICPGRAAAGLAAVRPRDGLTAPGRRLCRTHGQSCVGKSKPQVAHQEAGPPHLPAGTDLRRCAHTRPTAHLPLVASFYVFTCLSRMVRLRRWHGAFPTRRARSTRTSHTARPPSRAGSRRWRAVRPRRPQTHFLSGSTGDSWRARARR